jgi:hypothetical protein
MVDDSVSRLLRPDVRIDFESGDETELRKGGGRGTIQALHSSPSSRAAGTATDASPTFNLWFKQLVYLSDFNASNSFLVR